MFLLPLLLACANHISGSVDGNAPSDPDDAVFDLVHSDMGVLDDLNTATVLLSSRRDTCAGVQDLDAVSGTTCSTTCSNLLLFADNWLGNGPFWALYLQIVGTDPVEGLYDYASLSGRSFGASLLWISEDVLHDAMACEDACHGETTDFLQFDLASGGSLEITAHETDHLKGEFTLAFEEDTLEGGFSAASCDME